jgi:hydrogenase accessory protein HypB
MHELGITRNIVAIVGERAGTSRVNRVAVEIGKLSAVMPDAVRFCFDVCAKGTCLEGAELEIREIAGRGKCLECSETFDLAAPYGRCVCDVSAARNRGWFEGRGILALNLVSSPGSGKTTLLERTLRDLKDEWPIGVVEGDQATARDAERIRATGCDAVQINTGAGCHLDADMLSRGLRELDPATNSVVLIENVGNLVCPALFDLGERCKVAILSVTEGEDKPLKYPHMFRASRLLLLSKIDLLPHVDFDVARCIDFARSVHPEIEVLQVSATTGAGLANWYEWLRQERRAVLTGTST